MDNFAEQLVKKGDTGVMKRMRTSMAVSGTLFSLALLALAIIQMGSFLSVFGFVLAIAGGIMTYFMVQNTKVEYEYTFTNGELDVDKIIAKKKRREMITVNVHSIKEIGVYKDDTPEPDDLVLVDASDGGVSQTYFADFDHETYGNTRLLFVPNEKMLDNIRKFLPAKVKAALPKPVRTAEPEEDDEAETEE